MNVHKVVLLPTGKQFVALEFDCATLPIDRLRGFQAAFSRRTKFDLTFPSPIGDLRVKWTGASSCGLATTSFQDRPLLSSVLVSGRQEAADAELLAMFVQSVGRTAIVQQMRASASPFQDLLTTKARPLVASVLWPIIP